MNNENLDNAADDELSKLYQQRKAEIITPQVNVAQLQKANKKSVSIARMLSIFAAAGGASFAIFAIITHFATTTANSPSVTEFSKPIVVEKLPPETDKNKEQDTYSVAIPPLPPQPNTKINPIQIVKADKSEQLASNEITLPKSYIQGLDVQPLKQPELALKPIYKVLPKYFIEGKNKSFSGEVKLSYQIKKNGTTTNIKVMSSNVDRELKKSARKALSQWQYKAADNYNGVYEIIFEFTQ